MPRVALLVLHSHADRSFLEDDDLARLGAALRARGVGCRQVEAVIEAAATGEAAAAELEAALADFDVVVFGRFFDPGVVERLRAARPGQRFLLCAGEHPVHEPPADEVLAPGRLVERLAPAEGTPVAAEPPLRLGAARSRSRVLVLQGATGCPYQADARDNPLYAGVHLPAGYGRGCAFCATGNHHEARAARELVASLLAQARELVVGAGADRRFVLKDQNPFVYLEELVRGLAAQGSAPLTLLLETRADWFLRGRGRVERALEAAERTGITLAPYLVGIESFSQPELDRFNKGIRAETNLELLATLRELQGAYPGRFTLSHAAFGFVLFTPWTTLADLRANHAAVVATRFYELRGRLLLSRARLYEDNALYYLAERDGLLADTFEDPRDDPSARFGYLPSRPWRFLHAETAHFARLATDLADRLPPGEEPALFEALLDAVSEAGDARRLGETEVLRRIDARRSHATPARTTESPLVVGGDDGPLATAELLAGDGLALLERRLRVAPRAGVVLALPPRVAADVLAEPSVAGREVLCEVPPPLAALAAFPGATIGFRWAALRTWQRIVAAAGREPLRSGEIELRGVPGAPVRSLERVVWEALALAGSLAVGWRLAGAAAVPGGLRLELEATGDRRLALLASPHGVPRAEARLRLGGVEIRWSAGDTERLEWRDSTGAPPRVAEVPTRVAGPLPTWRPAKGRAVPDAARVAPLARDALSLARPAPLPEELRLAERVASRDPSSLARFGLAGELPAGPPARVVAPPEVGRVELAALRAGIRPAAFLTVEPRELPQVRAALAGWVVVERERRVHVAAHDRWVDRRDEGEPRVELYVARSREEADALARLQAEEDPSRAARELGRLLGYPGCCVEAFASQGSRDDNTLNRYLVESRTSQGASCPWTLNGFELALVPFFPCRWDCAAARRWGSAAWNALASTRADRASVEAFLERPILYFSHGELVRFEGRAERTDAAWTVRYAGVEIPPRASPALARLASAIASGDTLVLDDDALTVLERGQLRVALRRREPRLGLGRGFSSA
ncbi:MAG: hypothetical protein IT376_12135 [Polyangiaceae bacterium]|nr:hypothetical protein [Polyangiaceae bacterium]